MKVCKLSLVVVGIASLSTLQLTAQAPPTKPANQNVKPNPPEGTAKLSAADAKFVHEAAAGGMAEVSLGKLAAGKATNPDVKQFAQRMVDDHSKANDELKALASQKGVTLPVDVDPAAKAIEGRLSKLSGETFDKAYMQDMVKDHDKDVAAFKHASTTAADADLKAWAAKTLPTLQEHQTLAKSLYAKVGAGAAKASGQH
jgi:putative membrane protein